MSIAVVGVSRYDQLTSLVFYIRKARGIILGESREGGQDDLGVVGQAFENLLYNPETDFAWMQVRENPALVERLIATAEDELMNCWR